MAEVRNVNVGILGHVDSGKTSLARALSTVVSTAGFDKHPQSQQRGITLDLGFSALRVDDAPSPLREKIGNLASGTQFTLVDCPGHASLIRTIIGGAQIIDAMMLVIDVTKGIEVQTAECLVIGEIIKRGTCPLLVVMNKVDLLPPASRDDAVEKMRKKVGLTLKKTKFADNFKTVVACAAPGGQGDTLRDAEGIEDVIRELCTMMPPTLTRFPNAPFLCLVDHCFAVKGQGTVLTGTVLQGTLAVGDTVEIVEIGEQRKVKGMQMFKKPVQRATHGDRVALCVTQLDPTDLERVLVAKPGHIPKSKRLVAEVERVRFYKSAVESYKKFHISLGHSTVLAEAIFFSRPCSRATVPLSEDDFSFEWSLEQSGKPDMGQEACGAGKQFFALLTFDDAIPCPPSAQLIASRLDSTAHTNSCRIAFAGQVFDQLLSTEAGTPVPLKVYKSKEKKGIIERVEGDGETAIVKGMFKKETDISAFLGMFVKVGVGEDTYSDGGGGCGSSDVHGSGEGGGKIVSTFGKSGKVKVHFPDQQISKFGSSKEVTLVFKKNIFGKDKKELFQ